jgi:hypothetical protein
MHRLTDQQANGTWTQRAQICSRSAAAACDLAGLLLYLRMLTVHQCPCHWHQKLKNHLQ